MFNTLLSYTSLVLSAKREDGKFAFKFSWHQLQKQQKRCTLLKLQKKTSMAWQLNYLQRSLLKFHKIYRRNYQILCKSLQFLTFLNHQEIVVKSLDTHTLKLALGNT